MLATTSSLVLKKRQLGAFFENRCGQQLKGICFFFYLKTEQCERGGKIAPF